MTRINSENGACYLIMTANKSESTVLEEPFDFV